MQLLHAGDRVQFKDYQGISMRGMGVVERVVFNEVNKSDNFSEWSVFIKFDAEYVITSGPWFQGRFELITPAGFMETENLPSTAAYIERYGRTKV